MDESELKFGESEFRGPPSLYLDLKRWFVQFCALLLKNTLILWRRKLSVACFLALPSFVVLVFLMEQKGSDSTAINNNRPAIPIEGLGDCNVYYTERCVRAVYSPLGYRTDLLMETLSAANGLEMGKDVLGFNSTETAQAYVANNLGTVQYTIFFSNVSLWETSYMSPNNVAVPTNLSYVIFYNDTQDDNDPRSDAYNLNFPLLTLQKGIETAYLQAFESKYEGYNVNYGQFWQQEAAFLNSTFGNSSTPCDWSRRPDLANLGTAMPWVIVFSFLFMATITFHLIAEEKRNKLFGFLRRLGLMDSAYWLSWFLIFQVMLLLACTIAMIAAAIVRTQSSALRAVDLNLLFLILWLSGTSFISFSCFLAALSNSASMTTSLYSGQFLIALVTVAACSNGVDYYESVGYNDGTVDASVCYLVSSSFNRVYSNQLMGYTFVQFLVFFLPWFHAAQAMSDVLSVVQYEGKSISISDIHDTVTLSYTADPDVTFDTPWIIQSLVMLIATTIVYMFLSWLAAQMLTADGTEGRGLHTILIPTALRRLLFREREIVQDGDIRGQERQLSATEGSVRAYKVSKTYSGVQALREVSFTMNKGEVFVLLGHNGAGKSTLINIITGMVSPTHGKVYMQGLDVEADSAQMQQIIGVCPQDDILWDDLTAREHMLLVAAFKGLRWGPALTKAVDQILSQVQLLDRCSDFARMYSGGMKRRLSVALSTVGDVQIIVFDEPTTGLDPLSRRRVWETINSLKRNRVVVLTTHNMEEADFLGDNIMIMHGGRVRAIGDSLFLKQTYGNGYQVGMLVAVECVEEVKAFVKNVLPGSACSADPVTGVVAVGVVKEDLGGLARLFQWLEHSRRAKAAVREWGISNTTLEQVFLMLCVQNTEVNYVDPGRQTTQNQHALCPMCRTRFRSAVIVRVWPPVPAEEGADVEMQNSPLIALADSVCAECARGNKHYYIPEDQAREVAGNPAALSAFIENAHIQAERAKTDAMLSTYETELQSLEEEKDDTVAQDTDALLPQVVAPQQVLKAPTVAFATGPYQGSIQGTAVAQVQALFVKNLTMQSKQRCANGCSVCFVGFMFLMLYIMSILLVGLSDSTQCAAGYLSSEGCEFDVLVHQIFSGTDEQLAFDEADTSLNLGPDGYAIRNYLVPVEMYNNYYITITNKILVDDYYPEYGLSAFNARGNIVWTSLAQAPQLTWMPDFMFNMMSTPTANGADATEHSPNDVQFTSQELSLEQLLASPVTDTCPYYNPDGIIGSYANYDYSQEFANVYSDVAFACPTCEAVAQGQRPSRVFYNGTLWMARNKEASEWWCSDISCFAYPYAFFDYESYSLNSSYYYLPGYDTCPPGVGYISKSANQEQDQTLLSLTFSNLLTNSLLDPWLRTYSIQGGYSHYGVLYFDAQSVSEAQAFWMVLFGMMLMNGFWPMAVWRAAHERAFGLVDMMNTVGLRPWTYLLGMFAFDMVVSLIAGIALLAFAVGVGLLNFKDAPIDLLVAIVVLSSYAFNACTLLISMLAGSKASVLSLLAACLTIGFAAISALLNNLIFPNEGDWPMALSILPFLAQGRALYIVLVYHTSTAEVSGSLLLMFGVGSIVLITAFLIDEQGSIGPAIAKFTGQTIPQVNTDLDEFAAQHDSAKEVAPAWQIGADSPNSRTPFDHAQNTPPTRNPVAIVPQADIRRELDEDLRREKMRAALYVRSKTAAERAAVLGSPTIGDVEAEEALPQDEQDRLAIVLHKMKFQFPVGGKLSDIGNMCAQGSAPDAAAAAVWAVNGLSLALSLGECFGLLGPNGAGKSTTISVLIGRLRATLGAQYIAGENVINGLSKVHRFIGVCPQFDVVWSDLTVAEHLSFQARQRGIPANLLNAKVQQAAVAVGLDGDGFYTKAGQLSGGMRRRLSIAMSLVGDPPIIFMDEPTTGLDPDNRQHIWHIIQKIKSPSRLILLTTHSMEEAEALCTRIGIMAKGQLRCVGSAQHLKAKYGKGYTLTVNSLPAANDEEMAERQRVLDAFILDDVGNGHASILSAINRTKKYLIDKSSAPSIAEIFKSMEAHKAHLGIREWGLSMTTLEEVFISAVEETVN